MNKFWKELAGIAIYALLFSIVNAIFGLETLTIVAFTLIINKISNQN